MVGTGGSTLPFGPGSALWKFWIKKVPGYLAMPHPWTSLHRDLLKAGIPARMADGLTTNLIQAVDPNHKFGHQK